MATPHIEAEAGQIADVVLMPGDPLRAKFIAETFLENIFLFNDVRNMIGYTGYYKGKKISVMGSGMGMASMGIYSYELFKFYNVKKIIRVGSCGALIPDLKLFDVVLVDKSYSDSTYALVQNGSTYTLIASSLDVTNHIAETASKEGIKIFRGNIYTTDVFTPYREAEETPDVKANNCIATEMETFALFHNARLFNREVACLLSVSDSPFLDHDATAEERETAFVAMIELALKSL